MSQIQQPRQLADETIGLPNETVVDGSDQANVHAVIASVESLTEP